MRYNTNIILAIYQSWNQHISFSTFVTNICCIWYVKLANTVQSRTMIRAQSNGLGVADTLSKCALCLDFYTVPVCRTNCGHNFCQRCLSGMLTDSNHNEDAWNCPECRSEQHQGLEQLARNFFLERTVEKFIESRKNLCAVHELPKKFRKCFKQSKRREFQNTVKALSVLDYQL